MNTDSRDENRAHAPVVPDYFRGHSLRFSFTTPLATDWEFREIPLVSGLWSCDTTLQNVMGRSDDDSLGVVSEGDGHRRHSATTSRALQDRIQDLGATEGIGLQIAGFWPTM
jgi:hypothetical protein